MPPPVARSVPAKRASELIALYGGERAALEGALTTLSTLDALAANVERCLTAAGIFRGAHEWDDLLWREIREGALEAASKESMTTREE